MSDFRSSCLDALRQNGARIRETRSVVGLDGFVDTIVTPVGLRRGQGEAFAPIATLAEFGRRIAAAAGKSTNIELFPRMDKLGGNGPIMANALLAHGTRLTYIGALGTPSVHPVFADLARRATVFSLATAAHTTAVECEDGKLMLGQMRSLDEITFERLQAVVGADGLRTALAAADLVALVNWTMIPNMTGIFEALVEQVLPAVGPVKARFFFDLADPEKRSVEDLRQALHAIGRFERYGRVTLGLNLKEAQQVAVALGVAPPDEDERSLRQAAAALRAALGIDTVVVHPRAAAACASAAGTAWVPGPYVEKPLITTGAGDHFNAGFSTGQLLGLDPQACLTLGVCTSGHYVRTGESPTLAQLESFLANWR
jgi:hypothetical protein